MNDFLSPVVLVTEEVIGLECYINTDVEYFYRKNANLSISQSVAKAEDSPRADMGFTRYLGQMSVSSEAFNDDEGAIKEFEIKITVRGKIDIFEEVLSTEQRNNIDYLAEFNLISLLYSYARVKIEGLTENTPYKKLILPTINVSAMLSNQEDAEATKDNTEE